VEHVFQTEEITFRESKANPQDICDLLVGSEIAKLEHKYSHD
jgi:hypothetical protein